MVDLGACKVTMSYEDYVRILANDLGISFELCSALLRLGEKYRATMDREMMTRVTGGTNLGFDRLSTWTHDATHLSIPRRREASAAREKTFNEDRQHQKVHMQQELYRRGYFRVHA